MILTWRPPKLQWPLVWLPNLAFEPDQCFLGNGPLPPTSSRGRRIDYALGSGAVCPTAILHRQGLPDHVSVAYDFSAVTLVGHAAPARAPLLSLSPSAAALQWEYSWDEQGFDAAIRHGDVDGAWQVLSDCTDRAGSLVLLLIGVRLPNRTSLCLFFVCGGLGGN